jgi:hypothetical protein
MAEAHAAGPILSWQWNVQVPVTLASRISHIRSNMCVKTRGSLHLNNVYIVYCYEGIVAVLFQALWLYVGFEVLTVVTVKSCVVRDVALCIR